MLLVLSYRWISGGSVGSGYSCTLSWPFGCRERHAWPAWRLVLWRESRAAEGREHVKEKEVGAELLGGRLASLTSSGTWGEDRIGSREICPENLYLEENKASKFSSVLANVWSGAAQTLEAWFSLRALMPVLYINNLFDLTPIEVAAIKKQKIASVGWGETGNLVHFWWERKTVQPLWEEYGSSSKKLKIQLHMIQ